MTNPTRQQWAAWLIACADEADDLHPHERHGLRLAATHMLNDYSTGMAAGIEGLDDVYMTGLKANLWADVEAGHERLRATSSSEAS